MHKIDINGMTVAELEEFVLSLGEQKYRGRQLFVWIHQKQASSFDEMTSFSKSLRRKFSSTARFFLPRLAGSQLSGGDGTTKLLFELQDGRRIESVLIPPRSAFEPGSAPADTEQKRLTLCVSTQVGCPLDCSFCATATMGFSRNLTSSEIVGQIAASRTIARTPITNVVYMGMGEPLLNYDHVMKSFEIMTGGMKIPARHITLSTAGWTPGIRRLADEGRKVKLAVSLHSLDNNVRSLLMPVNRKFDVEELLRSVRYYSGKIRQRVTFEYVLFDRLNDSDKDAEALVRVSRSIPCKVNLIPFHSIGFTHPSGFPATLRASRRLESFVEKLRRAFVTVFIRSSAGEDIDAACGQLAVTSGEGMKPRRVQPAHCA